MIRCKSELFFYIRADRMMNRGYFRCSFMQKIKNIFVPDYELRYLNFLRRREYFKNQEGYWNKFWYMVYKIKGLRLGVKLGFSIAEDVFGYGLVIPHYGTIVVGKGNRIGNYCVLHTSTCITEGKKEIGDAFYLSCGAKVIRNIRLRDGVSIGANSVVNKSFQESNCMLAGGPAKVIKQSEPWYIRDGDEYASRVKKCEMLRSDMGIKSL